MENTRCFIEMLAAATCSGLADGLRECEDLGMPHAPFWSESVGARVSLGTMLPALAIGFEADAAGCDDGEW